MVFKSSWLGGRIPSALLLLPLFWIALLLSPNLNQWKALWVLGITHLILYSSVNIHINFYDGENENSAVEKKSKFWLYAGVALHILAIVLGAIYVNRTFATLVLWYGTIAFLFGVIRGRRSAPSWVWAFVRVVQGLGATLIYYSGLNNYSLTQTAPKILFTGIVATLLLTALYPRDNSIKQTTQSPVVWPNVVLLILAGALAVWVCETVLLSQYTIGLIVSFIVGIGFVIARYNEDTQAKRIVPWRHWVGTIALNVYAFYLFTDYSQVLQLVIR